MDWTTADLDAIAAMAVAETRLQSVPDLYRRFIISVLAEMATEPPTLDGVEDVPPTDERLVDWIHGARSALLAPGYECPTGDTAMDIVIVEDVRNEHGGSSVANTWVQVDAFQEIIRDDTGEVYLADEGGPNSLVLPAGRWAIDSRHLVMLGSSVAVYAQFKLLVPSPSWEKEGDFLYVEQANNTQQVYGDVVATLDVTEAVSLQLWGKASITRADWAWGYYLAGWNGRYGRTILMRIDVPE